VTTWYARMADIPNIQFEGSPGVNRVLLAEAHIRPRSEYGYLSWPTLQGSTSASPAHQRAFSDFTSMNRNDLVRWVWEGLEIPGEPPDYHFLLQGAVEKLWSRRRSDPEGLGFVEIFGYLDLTLIEAAPQAVALDRADRPQGFVHIVTLDRLLTLLEREGALRDALALSRRAQRFGDVYRRESLEAKVAALDEERK